jgi:hypothetical protein
LRTDSKGYLLARSQLFNVQLQGMMGVVVLSYLYMVPLALCRLAKFLLPVKNDLLQASD